MRNAILLLGVSGVVAATVALHPASQGVTTHGEWVTYAGKSGDSVTAYIAFPERPDAAPAMIVIHEIFGMSEWVTGVADQFAAKGYVAIAPDLLSRRGGTRALGDDARRAIGGLPPDSITVDLNATYAYLRSLKSVRSDRVGVIGFCWGGSQSFRYATDNPQLKAAVVCYGSAPDSTALARIRAPVLGVYAENDARITASVPDVSKQMQQLGKPYTYDVYKGAGHAFLRRGEPAGEVGRAWERIFAFLDRSLSQ